MNPTPWTSAMTTNTSAHDREYTCNDLNFTGLSEKHLECLCLHKIPLRTLFPKLVLGICDSKEFDCLCKTKGFDKMNIQTIDTIIDTIQQFIKSSDTRVEKVSFHEPALWKALQSSFGVTDEDLRKQHEKLVEDKVNTNMKSNIYYQYSSNDVLIHSPKRTRKNKSDHQKNNIKYAREICIS